MSAKVSITLDREVLEFVDRSSQNRSQFINEILSSYLVLGFDPIFEL
jgi:metal-responsive CopG/Arc/MetJ family transcriptional regulator